MFLAYAAYMDFTVYQMDVKSAFLYGKVQEEVYVKQPPGFIDPTCPDRVYKLDRELYGLDQAPRAWYETMCREFEEVMRSKFEMRSMGEMKFFLGLQDDQSESGILIHQEKYVKEILTKFKMTESHPFKSPEEVRHSLSPDLDDSDYGGCNLDRKSTSGGCQFLGNRLVSWQCKKQTTVSQSTAEAEYITATLCFSQVRWIHHQMLDYGITFHETPILCDNTAVPHITKNPFQHSKTKNIEIKHHFIRDCVEKKHIKIVEVRTDKQTADIFTKAFDSARFEKLVEMLGMIIFYVPYLIPPSSTSSGMDLLFVKKHNVCAFLNAADPKCADFVPVFNFLANSNISFAISYNLPVFESSIRRFLTTATRVSINNIEHMRAIVQNQEVLFSEATIREANAMVASTILGLVKGRDYNFSGLVFRKMIANLTGRVKDKFLVYPRFLQMIISHLHPKLQQDGPLLVFDHMNAKILSYMKSSSSRTNKIIADVPLFGYIIGEVEEVVPDVDPNEAEVEAEQKIEQEVEQPIVEAHFIDQEIENLEHLNFQEQDANIEVEAANVDIEANVEGEAKSSETLDEAVY
ncbi:hypothetical protein L1987_20630 [Smallanthus sonchifolius]|uniref:Uncharacterized protein n=1 Tax=Smallanthus sonchifolius TaxID=185202 RepID=A0ACB9ISG7_9ASTR|nr:hypothetical protein L1987_20630 [Smallanthus sonchifolius]